MNHSLHVSVSLIDIVLTVKDNYSSCFVFYFDYYVVVVS